MVSHDSVVQSLLGAGLDKSALASLDLLEVGCGTYAALYLVPHRRRHSQSGS